MALAAADGLTFTYPGASRPALEDATVSIELGEVVVILGASGSGKSTLLRAFAGLVPHFHGGRFAGCVQVAGRDTRRTHPAELAGTVATVFQDPEEQIVLNRVVREVAFGLENLGAAPAEIVPRALDALRSVGAQHLAERDVAELSGGELQRVCLASALALEPELILLDEPTSQLDPDAADAFLELVSGLGIAVLMSEQRPSRALQHADRVLFAEDGRLILDATRDVAEEWLSKHRPLWLGLPDHDGVTVPGEEICRLDGVSFSYATVPVVEELDLGLRRGEIVALSGPNGCGKTTVAKLACGLLEPDAGTVMRSGRSAMLLQDPGRYTVRDRADDEVALGVGGAKVRAHAALAAVGLAGMESHNPRDLSSGERERLALASVLVVEPDLLVLDEPTRGVDPARKAQLADLLRRDSARRATLLVTHDGDFARATADRTIVLGRERALV